MIPQCAQCNKPTFNDKGERDIGEWVYRPGAEHTDHFPGALFCEVCEEAAPIGHSTYELHAKVQTGYPDGCHCQYCLNVKKNRKQAAGMPA
jgi:hypothetical protein